MTYRQTLGWFALIAGWGVAAVNGRWLALLVLSIAGLAGLIVLAIVRARKYPP